MSFAVVRQSIGTEARVLGTGMKAGEGRGPGRTLAYSKSAMASRAAMRPEFMAKHVFDPLPR